MSNYNSKGRPTTRTVSVLDNTTNSIIFTGSVSDFVNQNFHYCSEKAKKTAKAVMYQSADLGCSAFGGKIRVFNNLESF